MELGDGQSLVEAATNTQRQIEAVRTELDTYERRWKSLGATTVRTLVTTVKSIVT
jgi:hypothetical protein